MIANYNVHRDDNGTYSTETAALIQVGWVAYTFSSSTNQAVVGVTFPQAYTGLPIVVATGGGDQASGAVAYGNGANNIQGSITAKASEIISTGCDIHIYGTAGGWTSGETVYAQWMAIGV